MPNYRILLVDYEPRSVQALKTPLERAGHRVDVVGDGIRAVEAFGTTRPDLVLVEAMIPKKHGFEVCLELKKTPQGEKTPIVIFTGVYKGRKYRNQARHHYMCDEYLEKPISDSTLLETVDRLLAAKSAGAAESMATSRVEERAAGGGLSPSTSTEAEVPAPVLIPPDVFEAEIMARLDAVIPGAMSGPPPAATQDPPFPASMQASEMEVESALEHLAETIDGGENFVVAPPPADAAPGAGLADAIRDLADVEPGSESPESADPSNADLLAAAEELAAEAGSVSADADEADHVDAPQAADADEADRADAPQAAEADEQDRADEMSQVVSFDPKRSRKRRRSKRSKNRRRERKQDSGNTPGDGTHGAAPESLDEVSTDRAANAAVEIDDHPGAASDAEPMHYTPAAGEARRGGIPGWTWAVLAVLAIGLGVVGMFLLSRDSAPGSLRGSASDSPTPAPVDDSTAAATYPFLPGLATRLDESDPRTMLLDGLPSAAPVDGSGAAAAATGVPGGASSADTEATGPPGEPVTAGFALPELPRPASRRSPPERADAAPPPVAAPPEPFTPEPADPASATPAVPDAELSVEAVPPDAVSASDAGTEPAVASSNATPDDTNSDDRAAARYEALQSELEAASPPDEDVEADPPSSDASEPADDAEPKILNPLWTGMMADIKEVDVPPTILHQRFPEYTVRARKMRQEGVVELRVLVDERGDVIDIELVTPIPDSDLNSAAMKAVRKWKYMPARIEDYRVRVWKTERVKFAL